MSLADVVTLAAIAMILASALMFLVGARLKRSDWIVTLGLAVIVAGFSWWLHRSLGGDTVPFPETIFAAIAIGGIAATLWERWNPVGQVAFASVVVASGTFLVYAGKVIVTSDAGLWSSSVASALFALQVATLILLVATMFETIDVICRTQWRRVEGKKIVPGYAPKISIHVPIHSEPPELVIDTLDALSRLDYPDFEVLVIDNNTSDETLWRPVEAHCGNLGLRFHFFHLLPWPGYKSGALNFALSEMAPDAEIVAVVDADYIVEPHFLSDLAGHFTDPEISFVQTPQDYRDHLSRGRYGRALYRAYMYFFAVSMATRNEGNAIIYAGTMGLIRKSALEEVGGWSEWCITEDAELSLRLLAAGYRSLYIGETYGRGLMPLDIAGLKKQRYRWAFGGMQILRMHFRTLINPFSRLSLAQRFGYFNGALQWLNDPLALVYTIFLLAGMVSVLLDRPLMSPVLARDALMIFPLFLVTTLLRFLWAFRVRTGCAWSQAVDGLTVLLGLTWTVTLACVRGLTSRKGVFLRTPKKGAQSTALDAIKIVRVEAALALACLGGAAALWSHGSAPLFSARSLTIVMLLWAASTYTAAVRISAWSHLQRYSERAPWLPLALRERAYRSSRYMMAQRTAAYVFAIALLLSGLFYVGSESMSEAERMQLSERRSFQDTGDASIPQRKTSASKVMA